jgi:hypothetical protein
VEWKTGEVGSAYLFEKLRGKAERETIGVQRLQRAVADDDVEELRLQLAASYSKPRLRPRQQKDQIPPWSHSYLKALLGKGALP